MAYQTAALVAVSTLGSSIPKHMQELAVYVVLALAGILQAYVKPPAHIQLCVTSCCRRFAACF